MPDRPQAEKDLDALGKISRMVWEELATSKFPQILRVRLAPIWVQVMGRAYVEERQEYLKEQPDPDPAVDTQGL